MPLGSSGGDQSLVVLSKQPNATLAQRELLPVRFVPITRDHIDA
ncbi:hypothetical protein Thiowin_03499 [Thiorhodovibrio winogradskyi]|uniref:Uncharacterized protein n=1 Tax=Thiorhodovibrio winogradskyi TaxID=77007 RepID=A0ABZ0SBM2_9GAMM